MQKFIADHWEDVKSAAAAQEVTDDAEIRRFATICAFLCDNPELVSSRKRTNKPVPSTAAGISEFARQYFTCKNRHDTLGEPTTVPDEAVSIVMQVVYGYTPQQTEKIKREHQHSMSAENIVGALLERYIASVLEPHGWVWCAGDFVKAVDFLRYKASESEGPWLALQVKNRNNSENSSSSAIRNGKEIEKWFRTRAETGADNWANFPEEEFRHKLSEIEFRAFVRSYLKPISR